jgi:hypothetical protein
MKNLKISEVGLEILKLARITIAHET